VERSLYTDTDISVTPNTEEEHALRSGLLDTWLLGQVVLTDLGVGKELLLDVVVLDTVGAQPVLDRVQHLDVQLLQL
jgi:hypothetical protein